MKNRASILLATLLFCVLLSVQAVPVGSSNAVATLASALQVSVAPGSLLYAPGDVAELYGTVAFQDLARSDVPVTITIVDSYSRLWNQSIVVTGWQGDFYLAIPVLLGDAWGRYTVHANASFARATATATTSFVVAEQMVWIETDKPAYFPGEDVTITLFNWNSSTVVIGGLPGIDIYYAGERIYPTFHLFVVFYVGPGETWTEVWEQYNSVNGGPADPGVYLVEALVTGVHPWEIPSAVFVIIGPGDLNHDGGVDIADIVLASAAYGTREGDANWNPEADVALPHGIVNVYDIMSIVYYYGQSQ
jgi:hypothetical protein